MHRISSRTWLIPVALLVATCCQPLLARESRALRRPELIDGVPCIRHVSFHTDGSIRSCFLARDVEVRGQPLPARTKVTFTRGGALDCVYLPRDGEIQGYRLRGRGHGYQTCFHPDGTLSFGNLVDATEIEGVPCERSTFWIWTLRGNAGIRFHENGRLAGCLASRDFALRGRRFRRNDRVEFDPAGTPLHGSRPDP